MNVTTIEWGGCKPSDEARAALAQADVIIGVDVESQRQFTVFGTPPLESTGSLKQLSAMRMVQVPINSGRGDLEALTALVQEIKGLQAPRRPR